MSSFDVLSPHTPLLGNLFLEASAGTGKTFTIEHLVVRLLLEGSLTLDQILVVTFTRAATRELKLRIRANLESIIQEKGVKDWSYLKTCTEDQKDRLRLARAMFDQAQIFTIHGFCQKILQEFAFEAGWSFHIEPWEEREEREAVFLFLRKVLASLPQWQWFLLLKTFQFDMDSLCTALLKKTVSLQEETSEKILQDLQKEIEKLAPFPLLSQFEEIADNYKGIKEDDRVQAEILERMCQEKKIDQDALATLLLAPTLFLEKLDPSHLKVKAKVRTLPSHLAEVIQRLTPLLKKLRNEAFLLDQICHLWHEEKKKLLKERGKISPDDFLKGVEKALDSHDFIEAVQKKYGVAIIDEFQDTDEIQWKIFETLFFHSEMKAFYLVGDYKQSIYSFRRADVYTFLKAAERFSQKCSLSTNYRSEKGLIDQLNHLFCQKPWMDLPSWNQTLPVPKVQAHKEGQGVLHFFIASGKKGRSYLFPTIEMEENYFFPFIVQEISKLAINLSSVAILVKDRFQAKRVHSFLQKWHYPCSIQRDNSLSESLALVAFKEVLEAVLKGNLSSIKKAALGPFLQKTTDMSDGFILYAKEIFSGWKVTLEKKGIAAFCGAFLREDFKEGISILQKMLLLPDLKLYQDTRQIMETLIQTGDPQRVLESMEEIKKTEISDRVFSEGKGIQIMTVHASKGLEFDTVFALAAASREKEEISKEEEAEKLRQLYVALTRAKTRLYIPLAQEEGSSESDKLSPIELFCKKVEPDFSYYQTTSLNDVKPVCVPYTPLTLEELQEPQPFAYRQTSLFLSSFSALARSEEKNGPVLLQIREEGIETPSDSVPGGIQTGVIIHRIFERLWKEGGSIKSHLAQHGTLFHREHIEYFVDQEVLHTPLKPHTKTIVEWIEKTLHLPLKGFCLNDLSLNKVCVEMEFLFSQGEQLIKGFIDLWFEHEGKYYLVDWKTNSLENYTPQALIQAMEEGDYFLQAQLYTQALEKHLKRFENRPFEECFGGVFYIFVRGPAVCC